MNDQVFGKLRGVGRVDTEKLLSENRTDMLIFDSFIKNKLVFTKWKNKVTKERHLLFKPSEKVVKKQIKNKIKSYKMSWQCNF